MSAGRKIADTIMDRLEAQGIRFYFIEDSEDIRAAFSDAIDEARQGGVIAFCEAILHGDEDHRAWLREAARNYVAGTPLPAVRGKGYTEAKIEQARQEARREALEEAARVVESGKIADDSPRTEMERVFNAAYNCVAAKIRAKAKE